MDKILDRINKPDDLKKLNLIEKNELAKEIREYILEIVSKNGGHLASNLGVVELTIALHSVFNLQEDKNKYPHNFQYWHDMRIDQYHTKLAEEDEKQRQELYNQFSIIANKYLPLQRNLKEKNRRSNKARAL